MLRFAWLLSGALVAATPSSAFAGETSEETVTENPIDEGAVEQSVENQGDAGLLRAGENSVGLAAGMDYSIFTGELSYRRGVDIGRDQPLTPHIALAVPLFVGPRDLRLRMGASHAFKFGSHFALVPSVEPLVFRTLNNDVQKMVSFGSTAGFVAGYVGRRISVGAAVNYDITWTTHIRHSSIYRERVFADVEDGWYATTAANFRGGVHLVGRIRRLELGLDAGIARTGRFRPYLLVPGFYGTISGAWRW